MKHFDSLQTKELTESQSNAQSKCSTFHDYDDDSLLAEVSHDEAMMMTVIDTT